MPKEYTTIEMLNLAQLPENQGKEIKSSVRDDEIYIIHNSWIELKDGCACGLSFHKHNNAKWTFLQKPVDFMTAVNSGKAIKPKDNKYYLTWFTWFKEFCHLGSENTLKLINGEWFIDNGDI